MRIEITRDDLLELAEASKATPGSLMMMLKTTDGKRVELMVTAPVRRVRQRGKRAESRSMNQNTVDGQAALASEG